MPTSKTALGALLFALLCSLTGGRPLGWNSATASQRRGLRGLSAIQLPFSLQLDGIVVATGTGQRSLEHAIELTAASFCSSSATFLASLEQVIVRTVATIQLPPPPPGLPPSPPPKASVDRIVASVHTLLALNARNVTVGPLPPDASGVLRLSITLAGAPSEPAAVAVLSELRAAGAPSGPLAAAVADAAAGAQLWPLAQATLSVSFTLFAVSRAPATLAATLAAAAGDGEWAAAMAAGGFGSPLATLALLPGAAVPPPPPQQLPHPAGQPLEPIEIPDRLADSMNVAAGAAGAGAAVGAVLASVVALLVWRLLSRHRHSAAAAPPAAPKDTQLAEQQGKAPGAPPALGARALGEPPRAIRVGRQRWGLRERANPPADLDSAGGDGTDDSVAAPYPPAARPGAAPGPSGSDSAWTDPQHSADSTPRAGPHSSDFDRSPSHRAAATSSGSPASTSAAAAAGLHAPSPLGPAPARAPKSLRARWRAALKMSVPKFQYDVFLSYRPYDSELSDWIDSDLTNVKLRVFKDRTGDSAGRLWQEHVCGAVQSSAVFCPIITIDVIKSLTEARPTPTPLSSYAPSASLRADGPEDLMLAEWLLGLALFGAHQVWAVFPILIGPETGPAAPAAAACSPGASASTPTGGKGPAARVWDRGAFAAVTARERENLLHDAEYRRLKKLLPDVVPEATVRLVDSLLEKVNSWRLPEELRTKTVRELLLGRDPGPDSAASSYGLLSFDACLIQGQSSVLEVALVEQFVQPLLRALDDMEKQRRRRDQIKMVTAAAAAAEGVAAKVAGEMKGSVASLGGRISAIEELLRASVHARNSASSAGGSEIEAAQAAGPAGPPII